MGGGGGRGLSLFQVHLLILLGPPVVFFLWVQCSIPFGHYMAGPETSSVARPCACVSALPTCLFRQGCATNLSA